MNKTSIEWTHRPETGGAQGGFTWNPIRARNKETGKVGTFCTHASPGCSNCYAEAIGKRFGTGLAFNVPNLEKVEFFIDEKILEEPLKRKKPATIFVGDMFDLFHEAIALQGEEDDDPLTGPSVARVFDVIMRCPQHTFQLLTKRAANMKLFMECADNAEYRSDYPGVPFPPPNVWLGVSVESQKYADERIPLLLQTPAAVRFLSVEPMLEAVSIHLPEKFCNHPSMDGVRGTVPTLWQCSLCDGYVLHEDHPTKPGFVREVPGIDWVICGGESGPGARPFNLAWAESLQAQCKAAGVPFFMKQVGSKPLIPKAMELSARGEFLTETTCGDPARLIVTSKGGDMSEWPESLRVREFPAERSVDAPILR